MLMEDNKTTEILSNDQYEGREGNINYVTFNKPYNFEGKEYKGIDLSGLEDLTTNDLIRAQKQFERTGGVSILLEMNINYCCLLAARASKKPVEFFLGLPGKEGEKVKNRVSAFLLSQD